MSLTRGRKRVAFDLPPDLYNAMKSRAADTHRSVVAHLMWLVEQDIRAGQQQDRADQMTQQMTGQGR
jgi:hypothetical protein